MPKPPDPAFGVADVEPYLGEAGGTTWGSSVNLDGPDSDTVRRYIIENALMWLGEYHAQGGSAHLDIRIVEQAHGMLPHGSIAEMQ